MSEAQREIFADASWIASTHSASALPLFRKSFKLPGQPARATIAICGLGQFAHSPLSSVLLHFRPEIEAHIVQRKCPEGVCPMREEFTA